MVKRDSCAGSILPLSAIRYPLPFGSSPPSHPIQPARLFQYACAAGSSPAAESRLASVTWISPGQRLDWKKSGEPQRLQKLRVGLDRGLVARERLGTGLQHEARLARPDPGDEAGTLGAPAHRTVAMGDPERRQTDAVAHRAAEAAALDAPVGHTTRTFLNCQGSVSSRSSWNIRLRSTSGCHSVYSPTTRPRYGRQISRMRL